MLKTAGYFVCFFLLLFGLQHVPLPDLGRAAPAAAAIIIVLVVLPLIALLLKREGWSMGDIGLQAGSGMPTQLALGLGLGLGVVAVMMAMMILLTPLTIAPATSGNTVSSLLSALVVIFILGLMEEIVFRSYPLFRLNEAVGARAAIYVTSVAFAFYHGLAPENVLGPGVWGLFYGWMALKTKSIALPTGFHVGLNWMQALLGMKPKYGGSIWTLSLELGSGVLDAEALGLAMQLVLLVIGIVLVERQVRARSAQAAI